MLLRGTLVYTRRSVPQQCHLRRSLRTVHVMKPSGSGSSSPSSMQLGTRMEAGAGSGARRSVFAASLVAAAIAFIGTTLSEPSRAEEYEYKGQRRFHPKPLKFQLERARTYGSRANRWLPNKEANVQADRGEVLTVISESPFIAVVDGAFSQEECDALVAHGEDRGFEASMVAQAGISTMNSNRTSSSVTVDTHNPGQLPVIAKEAMARVARIVGAPKELIEPMEILHYEPGQYYTWHPDWFPRTPVEGQRVISAMVYLNDIPEECGGATEFESVVGKDGSKTTLVQPKMGRVILFHDVDEEGMIDLGTLHRGMQLKEGKTSVQKNILAMWFREHPIRKYSSLDRLRHSLGVLLLPDYAIFHPVECLYHRWAKKDLNERRQKSQKPQPPAN